MIARIKNTLHGFWNFIGDVLFTNTHVGGYMDGPQSLAYMIIFVSVTMYVIYKLDKKGVIDIDKIIDKWFTL